MNEIINYVMNSPENTNPNVLKGMLEQQKGTEPSIILDLNNSLKIACIPVHGGEAATVDIIIYDFTNWQKDPAPIFIKDRDNIIFQTGYDEGYIGPVNPNNYTTNELCLTVGKEALIINDYYGNKFYLIENNNDITPGEHQPK